MWRTPRALFPACRAWGGETVGAKAGLQPDLCGECGRGLGRRVHAPVYGLPGGGRRRKGLAVRCTPSSVCAGRCLWFGAAGELFQWPVPGVRGCAVGIRCVRWILIDLMRSDLFWGQHAANSKKY